MTAKKRKSSERKMRKKAVPPEAIYELWLAVDRGRKLPAHTLFGTVSSVRRGKSGKVTGVVSSKYIPKSMQHIPIDARWRIVKMRKLSDPEVVAYKL